MAEVLAEARKTSSVEGSAAKDEGRWPKCWRRRGRRARWSRAWKMNTVKSDAVDKVTMDERTSSFFFNGEEAVGTDRRHEALEHVQRQPSVVCIPRAKQNTLMCLRLNEERDGCRRLVRRRLWLVLLCIIAS